MRGCLQKIRKNEISLLHAGAAVLARAGADADAAACWRWRWKTWWLQACGQWRSQLRTHLRATRLALSRERLRAHDSASGMSPPATTSATPPEAVGGTTTTRPKARRRSRQRSRPKGDTTLSPAGAWGSRNSGELGPRPAEPSGQRAPLVAAQFRHGAKRQSTPPHNILMPASAPSPAVAIWRRLRGSSKPPREETKIRWHLSVSIRGGQSASEPKAKAPKVKRSREAASHVGAAGRGAAGFLFGFARYHRTPVQRGVIDC